MRVLKTKDNKVLYDTTNSAVYSGEIIEYTKASWHQCNEDVREYIEEVDYTGVPYNISYIDDYAPANPTMADWQLYQTPIGKTIDGVTYYNEIPNTETPFSSTNVAGTLMPLDQVRWLNVAYLPRNVRDLGGWSCDGGTVKYGKLFRGSELKSASEQIPESKIIMMTKECGIQAEMDLRGGSIDYDVSPLGEEVRFKHISGADTYYIDYSNIFLSSNRNAVIETFRFIFDNVIHNTPLYFHCTTGADRTGTVSLLIEGLLGVSQSDCDKDYELTSFCVNRKRTDTRWVGLIENIEALNGTTFRDKCVTLFAMFGFTADEINQFRRAMIDGTPEEVTPSINNYSITKTLTNVTVDNSANSINQYQPYYANVAPVSRGAISSVLITMGGVDITDQAFQGTPTNIYYDVISDLTHCSMDNDSTRVIAGQSFAANVAVDAGYYILNYSITMGGIDVSNYYSDGKITIPSVTGNLSITITAITQPQGNLADPTSADWKDGYRIKSDATTEALAGVNTTNYIPCSLNDTIRVKNLNIDYDTGGGFHVRFAIVDSQKTIPGEVGGVIWNDLLANGDASYDSSTNTYTFPVGVYYKNNTKYTYANTAYIRLCGAYPSGKTSADVIITVNEPID